MKTREEIEQEFNWSRRALQMRFEPQYKAINAAYVIELEALEAARDAALAELDDPMLQLLNAMKTNMACRECGPLCIACQNNLRDAIDDVVARRTQDTHVAKDCTWGDACEVASHWRRAQG